MLKNIFESVSSFFKTIICSVLLLAATAGAITFTYIIIMTCVRTAGTLWRNIFCDKWP